MSNLKRRNFLQLSGVASLAGVLPTTNVAKSLSIKSIVEPDFQVSFFGDGPMLSPKEYVQILDQMADENPRIQDQYGNGGIVEKLETTFAEITGKEKAIFMPSGTMANQLAIKVLSRERSKVFLQEQSHVFRDEADAAQTVHQKRLMPLGWERGVLR